MLAYSCQLPSLRISTFPILSRRAGDGARTRDIKLGRLALYQLSYSRSRLPRHRIDRTRQPPAPHGGGRIRTFEGLSRQIYSLLPLATWVPHPIAQSRRRCATRRLTRRADGENRTRNRLITNQVLCQLSYVSRPAHLRETRRIVGTYRVSSDYSARHYDATPIHGRARHHALRKPLHVARHPPGASFTTKPRSSAPRESGPPPRTRARAAPPVAHASAASAPFQQPHAPRVGNARGRASLPLRSTNRVHFAVVALQRQPRDLRANVEHAVDAPNASRARSTAAASVPAGRARHSPA